MKNFFYMIWLLSLFGCSTKFTNNNPTGKNFPSVIGQSLDKIKYSIPEDFLGDKVLFLIGFVLLNKVNYTENVDIQ